MNTKIIVALVLGIVLVGLTGAASAFVFTGFDSYAHTSISYMGPTASFQEDYFGTHTVSFAEDGISTQTDITIYSSPSYLFSSYEPAASIFGSYAPRYSFFP